MNRTALLSWALALYSGLTLLAMAPMNVGVALFLLALAIALGGPAGFFSGLGSVARDGGTGRSFFRLSLALAGFSLLSLASARLFPVSYNGRVPEVAFLKDAAKLWYLFLPMGVALALERIGASGRERVLHAWIAVFAALSAVGIVQYFTGWPRPQPIPTLPGRFHATLGLGHHLSVASIFIFPFFVALDRAARSFARRDSKVAWLYGMAAALGAAALFFTYSRTLWVVLPLGIAGWAVSRLSRRRALAALGAFALVLGIALSLAPVQERLFGNSMGIGERRNLWSANWEFFKARPWTGIGFRHNEEMSGPYLQQKLGVEDVFAGHAHNNLLEVLAGTGIGGAAAWLGWNALVFVALWRRRKDAEAFATGLFFAWVVFHLNGLTQVNFWEGKVQHQAALAVGWALYWARSRHEARDGA